MQWLGFSLIMQNTGPESIFDDLDSGPTFSGLAASRFMLSIFLVSAYQFLFTVDNINAGRQRAFCHKSSIKVICGFIPDII